MSSNNTTTTQAKPTTPAARAKPKQEYITWRYSENAGHYALTNYSVGSSEREGAPLSQRPEWLKNIITLGLVSSANLAQPPAILMWFTTTGDKALVSFRFFASDKVGA